MQDRIDYLLINGDYKKISDIPKSDLHIHSSNGGSRSLINELYGKEITERKTNFVSIHEFEEWITENINNKFVGGIGYFQRITAAFIQCKRDSIKELCMSFSLEEIKAWEDVDTFVKIINKLKNKYLQDTFFIPELSLNWNLSINKELELIETIINKNEFFRSIDICGEECVENVGNFKSIFKKAKKNDFKLRAHVGEFGSSKDIMRVVECLELDEVNHGISICDDIGALKFCVDNNIRFNVCPTSNIMMGRVTSYSNHPIKKMFNAGLIVTINSDDCLVFNNSVSEEYVNLYNAHTLEAFDLEIIRKYGLKNLK